MKETERPLPITRLPLGQVPAAVLVCGDPDRATRTTAYLDRAELLSEHREFRAYRGEYAGTEIVVCSHGVGAPGAAAAFEELIAAGARRLLRLGTCGGLRQDVQAGDLVIASAAVDATGYGRLSVPPGYPAVADYLLTHALYQEVVAAGHRFHTGIVLTTDNFYAGVDSPYMPDYQNLSRANVVAVEMECAALFHVGNLRRVQTGAILAVDGNVLERGETMEEYDPHREVVAAVVETGIEIALNVLRKMEGTQNGRWSE